MKAARKSASSERALPVPLTFYEVDAHGTITDSSVQEPKIRSDVFSNVSPSQIHSTDQLIAMVEGCSPLEYYFSQLAADCLSDIELELERDTSLSPTARHRFTFLAAKLRNNPDTGWQDWARHEGDPGLAYFKECIQNWLAEAIDWDDYEQFDSSWSGQSAALHFFHGVEGDVCEALGVVIIEGEHPGSSYYAAELTDGIEQANEVAQELGLDFRFRAEGSVAAANVTNAMDALGAIGSNKGTSV